MPIGWSGATARPSDASARPASIDWHGRARAAADGRSGSGNRNKLLFAAGHDRRALGGDGAGWATAKRDGGEAGRVDFGGVGDGRPNDRRPFGANHRVLDRQPLAFERGGAANRGRELADLTRQASASGAADSDFQL